MASTLAVLLILALAFRWAVRADRRSHRDAPRVLDFRGWRR